MTLHVRDGDADGGDGDGSDDGDCTHRDDDDDQDEADDAAPAGRTPPPPCVWRSPRWALADAVFFEVAHPKLRLDVLGAADPFDDAAQSPPPLHAASVGVLGPALLLSSSSGNAANASPRGGGGDDDAARGLPSVLVKARTLARHVCRRGRQKTEDGRYHSAPNLFSDERSPAATPHCTNTTLHRGESLVVPSPPHPPPSGPWAPPIPRRRDDTHDAR